MTAEEGLGSLHRPVGAFDLDLTPAAAHADGSAWSLTMRGLRPLLVDRDGMELCINRPHEAFVETPAGWRRETLPFADFDWCTRLAKLIANSTQQRVDATSPLLSASLPSGERVQIVMPPATTAGCVAITIRRPADRIWSIEELAGGGRFSAPHPSAPNPGGTGGARHFPRDQTLHAKPR